MSRNFLSQQKRQQPLLFIRIGIMLFLFFLVLSASVYIGSSAGVKKLSKAFDLENATVTKGKSRADSSPVFLPGSLPHLENRGLKTSNKRVESQEATRFAPPPFPHWLSKSKTVPPAELVTAEAQTSLSPKMFNSIRDNAPFRQEEHAAWFYLLASLESSDTKDLLARSVGLIGYAQLSSQPEVYRGKLVQVRGVVHQIEQLTAPENSQGIQHYYQLVVQGEAGQVWPIFIYALKLPTGFSLEKDLHTEISAVGYFFKNQSYKWEQGFGLAPTVLSKSILWKPAPVLRKSEKNKGSEWIRWGVLVTLLSLYGFWRWRIIKKRNASHYTQYDRFKKPTEEVSSEALNLLAEQPLNVPQEEIKIHLD